MAGGRVVENSGKLPLISEKADIIGLKYERLSISLVAFNKTGKEEPVHALEKLVAWGSSGPQVEQLHQYTAVGDMSSLWTIAINDQLCWEGISSQRNCHNRSLFYEFPLKTSAGDL